MGGHQVHQHIGNQQNVALIPPGQQRQPQQGQQGHGNKFQLFRFQAFLHRLHGIEENRLNHRQQRGLLLEEEILIVVGHHAVPGGSEIAGCRRKPCHRPHQQRPAGANAPFVLLQQPPQPQPQRHHRHIHRRILLDGQGQQRPQGCQWQVLPVDAIQQPQ